MFISLGMPSKVNNDTVIRYQDGVVLNWDKLEKFNLEGRQHIELINNVNGLLNRQAG